jgi:hypothetical protein
MFVFAITVNLASYSTIVWMDTLVCPNRETAEEKWRRIQASIPTSKVQEENEKETTGLLFKLTEFVKQRNSIPTDEGNKR